MSPYLANAILCHERCVSSAPPRGPERARWNGPPADTLLGELAAEATAKGLAIYPLAFHVDDDGHSRSGDVPVMSVRPFLC
jgi:hypothetical protein